MVGCMVAAGFHQVEPGEAVVLIINTCGFIDPAKEEAINTIFDAVRAREAGAAPAEQQIIVAGCLSQRYAKELAKERGCKALVLDSIEVMSPLPWYSESSL